MKKNGVSYENGFHIKNAEDIFPSAVSYIALIIHPSVMQAILFRTLNKIPILFLLKMFPEFLTSTLNILSGVWLYYPDIEFAL